MAELKGVSEEQIRRAGRWNQEQMVGCYLNSLPREFMGSMAGHPSQIGCFEIRRAAITPPPELLSLIWPELDAWKGQFGPQLHQVNDLAATGVTNLLLYLREVIVQDSIALRGMFPGHPVWHHAVFQHPAYTAFARKVEACMLAEEQEGPSQLSLLYQAMPLLVDHLKAMDARSDQRASELQALLDRVAESQQTQSTQLQFLMSGSLTFRLEAPRLAAAPAAAPAAAAAAALLAPVVTSTMASSRYASAQASVASTPPRLASPPPPPGPPPPPLPLPQPDHDEPPNAEPPRPPVYRMCRTVKTVKVLWREWTVGLGHGNPSIAALDSRWGSQWKEMYKGEYEGD